MGQQIHIHTIPNSDVNRAEIKNGRIIIRIRSKPIKGKANIELIKFLRKITHSKVYLVKGKSSPDKIIEVEGMDEESFIKHVFR